MKILDEVTTLEAAGSGTISSVLELVHTDHVSSEMLPGFVRPSPRLVGYCCSEDNPPQNCAAFVDGVFELVKGKGNLNSNCRVLGRADSSGSLSAVHHGHSYHFVHRLDDSDLSVDPWMFNGVGPHAAPLSFTQDWLSPDPQRGSIGSRVPQTPLTEEHAVVWTIPLRRLVEPHCNAPGFQSAVECIDNGTDKSVRHVGNPEKTQHNMQRWQGINGSEALYAMQKQITTKCWNAGVLFQCYPVLLHLISTPRYLKYTQTFYEYARVCTLSPCSMGVHHVWGPWVSENRSRNS